MIISHKHKFIFVKTRKTAGTSIEIALSSICGDEDIITPISSEDEKIRTELGYRGPQNYQLALSGYSFNELAIRLLKGKRKEFKNHIGAAQIKRLIGEDIWNGYYKFTIERNPFDKMVSRYYWDESNLELNDYIIKFAYQNSDFEKYSINGQIVADDIFKLERIDDMMDALSERFGAKLSLDNIKAKGNYRKKREHYSLLINDEARRAIEISFAREMSYLDYFWEPKTN